MQVDTVYKRTNDWKSKNGLESPNMGIVFLQILPLALAAIAPTMIVLVVLFLSDDRGLVGALAFILGK